MIALTCLALAGMVSAGSLLAATSGATNAVPAGAVGAPAPFGHAASAPTKKRLPAAPVKLVDINGANRAQLKALPGIGDAEADKIIAGRPYLSKAELVTKNVLPTGPYLSLKDRVVAMPRIKPKGKS
ncbi:MAG: helix-hairpin-helix domain-containing protein [Rubrivivax sp.]|nr:helix-hairpin-helix domain-containing protein [Rubrivivax sp.]